MFTGGAGKLGGLGDQGLLGILRGELNDLALVFCVLVADGNPAGPVVERHRQPRCPHRVVRVHGGDQTEALVSGHAPEPRHVDLALGHDAQQDIDRLFGNPVELLDIQQPAIAHGPDERTVGEVLRTVPLFQDQRRIKGSDQPGRRQLGAALNEHELGVPGLGNLPEQRGLTGTWRPLEQDVGARRERCSHQFQLALAPDDLFRHPVNDLGSADSRGQCSWTMTPRTFLPASRSS